MAKSKKGILGFILVITLAVGIFVVFQFVLNPLINTRKHPIAFFALNDGSERIVAVYYKTEYHGSSKNNTGSGTNYTDAYDEIKGYVIELVDPVANKVISSVTIKKKPDEIDRSKVFMNDKNEIYIIFSPSSTSKSKGFVEVRKINGDQIEVGSAPNMDGLIFESFEDDFAIVKNQYNEMQCLDYATGIISKAGCKHTNGNYAETMNDGTRFFLLPYDVGSTRYIPYFLNYVPDDNFYDGKPGDDLYRSLQKPFTMDLAYNPDDKTRATDLNTFTRCTKKMKKPEYVNKIQNGELILNVPNVLFETDSTWLLTATDNGISKFYYFNTTSLIWSVEVPKLSEEIPNRSYILNPTQKDFIIISNDNWILCVDNDRGTIKWKYPK